MRILVICIILLFSETAANAQAQMSQTCQFQRGMRNGQVQGFPNAMPIPVGYPCHDGAGNTGQAIPNRGKSCQFNSGLFAGRVVSYEWLGYTLPEGASCQDGMGGTGIATAANPNYTLSQTCRYMTGPKAGTLEKFPSISAVNIGTQCWDGVASFGIAFFEDGSSPSNTWNGDPDTSAVPTAAEIAAVTQGSQAQYTPMNAMKDCLPSAAGGEAAFGACISGRMPSDAIQQCAANCNACFGKFDFNNYNCKVITSLASKIGINPVKIAKPIDKVWGAVKKVSNMIKIF